MSTGYADKLTFREDLGGQLGAAELQETEDDFESKVSILADWVKDCKRLVIFTGAGISTSTGIPDFRGPNGVWTLKRLGKPVPPPKSSFIAAKPSLTHQAMVGLMNEGKLKYVVSQNVDGLHLRSGIPRKMLAELHGNCFAERCRRCGHEYIREFEIETVGFKETGRKCVQKRCRGVLQDHILDWDDALPEDELKESEKQSSMADLVICLGTSLQITPACNLPLRTLKKGGRLVIINFQKTPKDKKASLVIHSPVDAVMQQVMTRNNFKIPLYERFAEISVLHMASMNERTEECELEVSIEGKNGQPCSSLIKSATFSLQAESGQSLKITRLETKEKSQAKWLLDKAECLICEIQLAMDAALDQDKQNQTLIHRIDLTSLKGKKKRVSAETQHLCLVQVIDYEQSGKIQPDFKSEQKAKRAKLA